MSMPRLAPLFRAAVVADLAASGKSCETRDGAAQDVRPHRRGTRAAEAIG
jgi:hypothetical protein